MKMSVFKPFYTSMAIKPLRRKYLLSVNECLDKSNLMQCTAHIPICILTLSFHCIFLSLFLYRSILLFLQTKPIYRFKYDAQSASDYQTFTYCIVLDVIVYPCINLRQPLRLTYNNIFSAWFFDTSSYNSIRIIIWHSRGPISNILTFKTNTIKRHVYFRCIQNVLKDDIWIAKRSSFATKKRDVLPSDFVDDYA